MLPVPSCRPVPPAATIRTPPDPPPAAGSARHPRLPRSAAATALPTSLAGGRTPPRLPRPPRQGRQARSEPVFVPCFPPWVTRIVDQVPAFPSESATSRQQDSHGTALRT